MSSTNNKVVYCYYRSSWKRNVSIVGWKPEDLRKPIPGFVRAYSPYENVITENEKGSKTKQMAL